MFRAWILAASWAVPGLALAADPSGTLTILEGDALVYRAAGRLHGAEGLRVQPGDIVETASGGFAQLELADRSVVQLGPATRLLVQAASVRPKSEPSLYVLDGWVKVAGAARDAASARGLDIRTPLLELPAGPAVVVLRTSPAEASVFVERGDVRLVERQPSGPPVAVALRPGDFYRRKAGVRGVASASAPQAFVAEVPRPFRDSLPLRAERFRDRPAPARAAPDFGYADVEAWLKAEPQVRRPLVQRWRVKAREASFRSALVANLPAHPEWDPILFPEKYKPREPPAPANVAARPAGLPSSAAP